MKSDCRVSGYVNNALYSAALRHLSVTQRKKNLETTHHKFQQRILGRTRLEMAKSLSTRHCIVKKRRLGWLWGMSCIMIDSRLPRQSLYWEVDTIKRKPGRPGEELDGYHSPRSEGNEIDLGRSTTAFCQQRRMASKCGQRCVRHGMN